METILRSEAKKLIEKGILFSLGFVTADRRRGIAGEYILVEGWQKMREEPSEDVMPGKPAPVKELLKDPRHNVHKTFMIHNPTNRMIHPIKVHYRLMDRFNGKTIIQ